MCQDVFSLFHRSKKHLLGYLNSLKDLLNMHQDDVQNSMADIHGRAEYYTYILDIHFRFRKLKKDYKLDQLLQLKE